MTLAVLAALAYAGVIAYASSRQTDLAPVIITLGAFGGVLLAFVLVRRHVELLGWALGLAGVAYALALVVRGSGVDEAAPLVALGLILCGELAAWSADERWPIAADRGIVASRAIAVAGLALAGLAVSALVVGLAATTVGNGLAWTFLGAVAAVLALALTTRLAHRRE